jgi:hypothetical protein
VQKYLCHTKHTHSLPYCRCSCCCLAEPLLHLLLLLLLPRWLLTDTTVAWCGARRGGGGAKHSVAFPTELCPQPRPTTLVLLLAWWDAAPCLSCR